MLYNILENLMIENIKTLQKAYDDISQNYRSRTLGTFRWHSEHFTAYALARMPATYTVLKDILDHVPLDMTSVLDLGSGSGSGYFAIKERWPQLEVITCIEASKGMIDMAQQLIKDLKVSYVHKQLEDAEFPTADLVLCSYSLNEIKDPLEMVKKAWNAASKALVIAEPGTPHGYQKLMEVREALIQAGAFILAPCPHHLACPLLNTLDDWCHFSTRVRRTKMHMKLKSGTLPYEDEKYCYLIAVKDSLPKSKGRLIKRPLKRKGHVVLDICEARGKVERVIVTKKDPDCYKIAIKREWGDGWN